MAAEAVYQIKQTEDQGRETVRKAGDTAKQIVADAKKKGEEHRKTVLEDAMRQRETIIRAAVERANKECEAIVKQGAVQRESLMNPESSKLESAIQLVMERIVSVNGNC